VKYEILLSHLRMVFGEIYGGFVAFEVSLLIDSFLNGS
jgi:hypothetical protein